MIIRFLLIIGGLAVVGVVGAFLFYVSVLTIMTTMVMVIGLIATLALGYWAGSNSVGDPPKHKHLRKVSVINASGEVTY